MSFTHHLHSLPLPRKLKSVSSGYHHLRFTGWEESGFICWGSGDPRSCYSYFTWMYLKCSSGLARLPSLRRYRSPSHQVVYPPGSAVPPWVTASRFLSGNRESELKPTTFSFLFSWTPNDIVSPSAACWGYSLIRTTSALPIISFSLLTQLLLIISNTIYSTNGSSVSLVDILSLLL